MLPSLFVKEQLQFISSVQTVLPGCGEGRAHPFLLMSGILVILAGWQPPVGFSPNGFLVLPFLQCLSTLNSASIYQLPQIVLEVNNELLDDAWSSDSDTDNE